MNRICITIVPCVTFGDVWVLTITLSLAKVCDGCDGFFLVIILYRGKEEKKREKRKKEKKKKTFPPI